MNPAERVLLSLVLREQEPVCVPVAELAAECELSESQVRRALRELREQGRLVPVGKRGNATAWRIADEPPVAASAASSPERHPFGGDGPGGRTAEPHDQPPAEPSPVVSEDDELSPEEWARRRAIGLRHAYAFLDRYDEVIGEPDLEAGECGECGRWARRRWSLGMFVLCRDCRRRRARAAAIAVIAPLPPAAVAVPVMEGEELERELAALVEQHSGNGNGNRNGSPLWDEPEF